MINSRQPFACSVFRKSMMECQPFLVTAGGCAYRAHAEGQGDHHGAHECAHAQHHICRRAWRLTGPPASALTLPLRLSLHPILPPVVAHCPVHLPPPVPVTRSQLAVYSAPVLCSCPPRFWQCSTTEMSTPGCPDGHTRATTEAWLMLQVGETPGDSARAASTG